MINGQLRSYPRFPATAWWALREEFKKSMPKSVNVAYLTSKLNMAPKSAVNIIPNLRVLGLIDEAGTPSEVAERWRHDDTYRSACDEMLQRAFGDVVDIFPAPDVNREQLQRWFAQTTRAGESSARQMAAFYLLVATSASDARVAKAEKVDKPNRATRPTTASKNVQGSNGRASTTPSVPNEFSGTGKPAGPTLPTLHLNLQIHLPAEASDAQIESLFRNMAKYIYGRTPDEQPV